MNARSKWLPDFQDWDGPKVHISIEGEIARDLVARWGTVAAIPDGEDSAGRSKLRLQSPEELVNRAVEVADLLTKTMDANGWLSWVDRKKKEEKATT